MPRSVPEAPLQTSPIVLFPELAAFVGRARDEVAAIPPQRRVLLEELARLIRTSTAAHARVRLVFICTHNSRRSQMAQIWALVGAHVAGVAGVESSSGGTEVTAFNPRAVGAMRRAGYVIDAPDGAENPVYSVRYAEGAEPLRCFSKAFDSPPNPAAGFVAVMTCAAADAACPVVAGAAARISLPYDDPGNFDGSAREREAYDDCCRRVAREMLYTFSLVRR